MGPATHAVAPPKGSDVEEGLEEDYLMENIVTGAPKNEGVGSSSYSEEYQEVISQLARLCSIISHNEKQIAKEKRVRIEEAEILELCPRIFTILQDFDRQPSKVKQSCHLETLLKGTFSLIAIKNARSVMRVSSLNIQLFLKVFERYIFASA
jgi:hypothetical protein